MNLANSSSRGKFYRLNRCDNKLGRAKISQALSSCSNLIKSSYNKSVVWWWFSQRIVIGFPIITVLVS